MNIETTASSTDVIKVQDSSEANIEIKTEMSELASRLIGLVREKGLDVTVTPFGKEVFTCQQVTNIIKMPGEQIGKAMVAEVDGNFVITLLPGSHKLNLNGVKTACKAKKATLVKIDQVELITGVKPGSVTPLLCLENNSTIKVVFDKALYNQDIINIGTGDLSFGLSVEPKGLFQILGAKLGEISKL